MKTALIGHRLILEKNVEALLLEAIQAKINNGCKTFMMGTHGEFDVMALNACRHLRNVYADMEIEVVITSLNAVKKNSELNFVPYNDVKTLMYHIEDTHFKRQITLSNKQMIDSCDSLICYVDTSVYRSGAKTALLYAEKKGLEIINLYRNGNQRCLN